MKNRISNQRTKAETPGNPYDLQLVPKLPQESWNIPGKIYFKVSTLPSISVTEFTFLLSSSVLFYHVCFRLRACKNARSLKETPNSLRQVSYLSIRFCEAEKQYPLPQRLNSTWPLIFFTQMAHFMRTAVIVYKMTIGFWRLQFQQSESHRVK